MIYEIPEECANCRFFNSGVCDDPWYSRNPSCVLHDKVIAMLAADDEDGDLVEAGVSDEEHYDVGKPKFCTIKRVITE